MAEEPDRQPDGGTGGPSGADAPPHARTVAGTGARVAAGPDARSGARMVPSTGEPTARLPAGERTPHPVRDRGATAIADRVVAKIAAQAARESLERVPPGGSPPHASVVVHRDVARVSVSLELDYPSDIGRQCGAVRSRVRTRVEELVGMEVHEVAVHVERLHSARTRPTAQRGRLS